MMVSREVEVVISSKVSWHALQVNSKRGIYNSLRRNGKKVSSSSGCRFTAPMGNYCIISVGILSMSRLFPLNFACLGKPFGLLGNKKR
jgi:hypothetical protein